MRRSRSNSALQGLQGLSPLQGTQSAQGPQQQPFQAIDTATDNPAFTPPWQVGGAFPSVPSSASIVGKAVMNTSPWGPWLDAAGAKEPGGIRLGGSFGNVSDSLTGLESAGPSPQERLMRQAQMQNQSQRAANLYPNAKNFPYNPYPQSS